MSAIQEQVLEAMNILSQNAVTKSNATIVIECEIVDIIDAGLGQYTVKYAENQFDVYSNNSNTYQKGDMVSVIVPEGNFEKTKTIIGAVAPTASMYIVSETSDKYVPVSENLFVSIDDIELCTYHSEERNLNLNVDNFGLIFKDYLENYKNFVFSARVKTNISIEQQQTGNYGLKLQLPFIEDAGTGTGTIATYKEVIIDINSMQGNPYRFNEYSLQNIYFQIAEGARYDTSRNPIIKAFVQDFAQDSSVHPADIWIKDVQLNVVDVLSQEDQDGYFLTVVASEGNYFLEGKYVTNKTLTPILKINGKNKKLTGYECYWFVEDSSIKPDVEGYYYLGGLGWKCLNKKTNVQYNEEGKMTYQYVTNDYSLSVAAENVINTLKYKCIVTKDDIMAKGEVCLKNLNSNIDIKLLSSTGSSTFVKDTGYAFLIARIFYDGVTNNSHSSVSIETAWQRFDRNNNFLDDNFFEYVKINEPYTENGKTYLDTEIKFPCSLIENSNLINCSFYGLTTKNGSIVKNNLGTASLIIDVSENYTYKLIIQNGDVLYKYDADGDSPMVADYDGPASSKIKEISPISYRFFKEDGTELDDIEYQYCNVEWKIPKNSMIKLKTISTREDDKYYYVIGKGKLDLNYTIIDTYNVKKNDNCIILTVNFNNNVLTENINIKFLKDGESGTNGSKYAGIITYGGYGYGEINTAGKPHKLHPVLVINTWRLCNSSTGTVDSFGNPKLNVSVYKDGGLINSSEYEIEWSMFDSSVTKPLFSVTDSGTLYVVSTTWPVDNETSNIVQAKITVGNEGRTGGQEVIYAYYPIEITYLPNANYANGIIPNLIGGFDKVLYAADGTNPKYDNTNSFTYADNLQDIDPEGYFTYTWSVSNNGNLEIKKIESNTCTIKPVTKFDNGKSLNYINTTMTITTSGRSQVQSEINQVTVYRTSKSNEVSYNQGVKQHLLDFINNFSYNNYVGMLNSSSDLLLYRSNLIYYIEQLIDILNELYDYCNTKNISTSDFNYRTIYNNNLNILNSENNILYNLGKNNNLDNLNRLNIKIIITSEKINDIKNHSGIAIAENLVSYINRFNDILEKKYWVSYDLLCAKINGTYVLQNQFNSFKTLENNIVTLCNNNTNLNWLQTAYLGFGPEQEFVNLKNQLIVIANKFFEPSKKCYTYDSIKKEILDEFKNLILKYQDSYYQSKYTNKNASLEIEIQELTKDLNDYNKIIVSQTSGTIKHNKPIVMLLNRYELSNINGWDGNKLYIDENNNEYLLAPQIGAGIKERLSKQFTGVVMGVKQFNNSGIQHIGLFGYSSGIQSYFMNAIDGSVIMGKSGAGQIIADPSQNKALLYSSTFWKNFGNDGKPSSYTSSNWNNQGMLIDLSTPEIRFGNGNFIVTSEGHLTAKGGGEIAGWKIGDTQLYSNVTTSNGRLTLDSTDGGKIYTYNHNTLNATSKGFYLSKNGLSITGEYIEDGVTRRSRFELNMEGNPKLYSGGHDTLDSTAKGFYLSQDGLSISNGSRSRIELNTSGDPKIYSNSKNTLSSNRNGFYLANDGLSIGSKFKVTNEGDLTATNVNLSGEIRADSGYIGDWTIDEGSLDCENMHINRNGITLGDNFSVDDDGKLTVNNAEIHGSIYSNNGKIAGWTITGNSLEADSGFKINSDGTHNLQGRSSYIDLNAEGALYGCHINGSNVVFSSNEIRLTRSQGSDSVSTGQNAGITYLGSDNNYHYLEFLHGILISSS